MWEKVKAFCLNSTTIAWSYFLMGVGSLLQVVDAASDVLGDPSIKDTITSVIGDAQTVGRIMLGISVVNIIARMRSLRRAAISPPPEDNTNVDGHP